jgi:hypothetical protein
MVPAAALAALLPLPLARRVLKAATEELQYLIYDKYHIKVMVTHKEVVMHKETNKGAFSNLSGPAVMDWIEGEMAEAGVSVPIGLLAFACCEELHDGQKQLYKAFSEAFKTDSAYPIIRLARAVQILLLRRKPRPGRGPLTVLSSIDPVRSFNPTKPCRIAV